MGKKVTVRLIIAIVSTVLEEAALAVGVLWGLPRLGIHIPLWVLIIVMVAWGAYTVITYRMGSRALRRKPVGGLTAMVGSKGEVATPLAPEGFIRIKGELWRATSVDKSIEVGDEVTVVGQNGLKLAVRKNSPNDLEGTK